MTPAIQIETVTVVYGSGAAATRALDSVDLTIRTGEMTALMGPSGSGKTSLLMVMGCLLRPTSGGIRLFGRDVAALDDAAASRLRLEGIGFVFQSYNLFPALNASQNVGLVLELKGWRGRRAAAEEARLLAQVGLTPRRHAFPGQLSGGEKQRVAIARALAGNPPLLLADEPTAALDARNGRIVVDLLRRLAHEENKAVVVVTHDPRVADLADRVVNIEDGRIRHGPTRRPAREAADALG